MVARILFWVRKFQGSEQGPVLTSEGVPTQMCWVMSLGLAWLCWRHTARIPRGSESACPDNPSHSILPVARNRVVMYFDMFLSTPLLVEFCLVTVAARRTTAPLLFLVEGIMVLQGGE